MDSNSTSKKLMAEDNGNHINICLQIIQDNYVHSMKKICSSNDNNKTDIIFKYIY